MWSFIVEADKIKYLSTSCPPCKILGLPFPFLFLPPSPLLFCSLHSLGPSLLAFLPFPFILSATALLMSLLFACACVIPLNQQAYLNKDRLFLGNLGKYGDKEVARTNTSI